MALHTQGDLDEAIDVLERALMLAESEGYIRTFVDEGHPIAELLHLAFAKENLTKLLQEITRSTRA